MQWGNMKRTRFTLVLIALLFSFVFTVSAQDPDSDGDGVPDSQDRCPNVFWQSPSGCPDTDGDGIDDGSDQCPFEAYATQNGCAPDADGDGVPDVNDQCPGSPGTSLNNGCPEGGQAEPTPAPPSPVPQIQLPTTGACVITPAGGLPVNVRADRSTDAEVVTQLQPGLLYFPNALIDGWYGLTDPAGWVRADVVLSGGDCSGLDDQPPFEVPTTDFTPDFGNCGEISQQVSRVPVAVLMRLLNSTDPCGGLTTYLRDRAFNPPAPPAPGAQALSGSLQPQCSSDLRPYPSPEALRYLSALQAVDEELAANVAAQVAASIGAAPGSDGDRFICALMRGDGFVVGTMIRRNTNEMGAYWTAMCVPPVEASYVSTIYNALGFDPLPGTVASAAGVSLIPPEAALIIALNDQNNPLTTRTRAWCSAFTATPPAQAETTPERQAIIDWLIGCGFFDQAMAQQLIHALNSGGVQFPADASLFPGLSITWEALETIYAANGNGQNCPTAVEILSGVPRFRLPTSLPDTINLPAPTFFVGQIYLVQPCDEQSAVVPSNTAPAGCFAQPVYRFSSSASGGRPRPVGVNLPEFGLGGQQALGSLNAEITHYVLKPNFVKDSFEQGLAGVTVQVYNGFCSSINAPTTPSGGLLRTVTTDSNGVFSIEGLNEGQNYCALVDAASAENSGIFGRGSWWWNAIAPSDARISADTRTAPTTIGINFTAPPADQIQPVRPYGWLRDGSSRVAELLIPTEINLNGLFLDLLPSADALQRRLQPFRVSLSVFDDQCDPTGWDGTAPNIPPFCLAYPSFEEGRSLGIAADGEKALAETGIPGVTVALYEGSCGGSGSPIMVGTTDDSGYITFSVTPTRVNQPYCALVDAGVEANAAILREGGWSTISGSRIYYGFVEGRSNYSVDFGWWRQAENVVGVPSSPFENLTGLLPIDGDAAPTPEGDGSLPDQYLVNFNMIVFDDRCDASGWDGNFRWLPQGCATWEPATLRANATLEPETGEVGIPNVTIDLLQGDCASGTFVGSVPTNDAGRVISETPILMTPGEYCFVIDPAQHDNAAALQPGMWSATGTQVIRIPQTVDRDLSLTTTIGWWRTAPGSVTLPRLEDVPIIPGIAGIEPFAPAICPAGSSCEDIPPRTEPIPDVTTLFPEIDPAALSGLADAIAQFGDRFGNTNALGILIGRSAPGAPGNLFLYEGGNVFDIGGGTDSEEAPSVSPTGILIGYISRDQNGVGTLMIQNLDNGIFFPAFRDIPGMRLVGDSPLWSEDGRALLITLADENGVPGVYLLRLDDPNAPPEPFLDNGRNPAITGDGALTAFIREGNVFIRFNENGAERQITQNPEGVVCDTPLFDAAGVTLYFNCRQGDSVTMFVQGFDGLRAVTPEGGASLARLDRFVDGVSIFSDGQSLFFGTDDATRLIPLVQIDGLQVIGMHWQG